MLLGQLVCSAAMLFLAGNLFAQIAVGGTTGTINDSQGTIITEARVMLTNHDTKAAQSTASTSTGVYVFNAARPGAYTLAVAKTGF